MSAHGTVLSVRGLRGTACARQACFNPFVNYFADKSPSASEQGVVVTVLRAIDANASIFVPTLETATQQLAFQESNESSMIRDAQ